MIQIWYAIRSLILRGPLNTLKLAVNEGRYEKQFGVRTSGFKTSASDRYFHYQGASYWVTQRIFKDMVKTTPSHSFMDIGCGKGRAVFVAERCGYRKLTGIDLDNELVTEARKNLSRYTPASPDSTISFSEANALEFDYPDEPTVYFLFNPFNPEVLEAVLARIQKHNRSDTRFIYMNPLYRRAFIDNGFKEVKRYSTLLYTEAIVYRKE